MFSNCEFLSEIDISSFDTSNVKLMAYLFLNCKNIKTINLSTFNTRNAISISNMFKDCLELEEADLSNFVIEQADSSDLFKNCSKLKNIKIKKDAYNKIKNQFLESNINIIYT